MPYTVVFENGDGDLTMKAVVDPLVARSKRTVLLRPDDRRPVASSGEISELVPAWPHWTARDWILAGNVKRGAWGDADTLPFIRDCAGSGYEYRLVRATDPIAYLEIWSMASYEEGIAELTLSSDCDVGSLVEWLQARTHVGPLDLPDDLCSWSYGLVYGGGSDEHLAVFRAREARATQRVWELVAQSNNSYTRAISRF